MLIQLFFRISLFLELSARFGKGEASCLAVAIFRGLKILTDDLDVRKFAQRRGIPISGTVGVLVLAVLNERISRDEGNRLLSGMIDKGFYSPVKRLDDITGSV